MKATAITVGISSGGGYYVSVGKPFSAVGSDSWALYPFETHHCYSRYAPVCDKVCDRACTLVAAICADRRILQLDSEYRILDSLVSGWRHHAIGRSGLDRLGDCLRGMVRNTSRGRVLFKPVLLGRPLGLRALPVFLALLAGSFLFRPVGFVLAVPVLAVANVFWPYFRARNVERSLGKPGA